jgi:hypothetical protein
MSASSLSSFLSLFIQILLGWESSPLADGELVPFGRARKTDRSLQTIRRC